MKTQHIPGRLAYGASFLALLLAASPLSAEEPKAPENKPAKALSLMAKDDLEVLDHVEIHGENPKIIYVPITHDNPEHANSPEARERIEEALMRAQLISEHLYSDYGVRKILLEGIGKSLSDKYNSPKYKGKKLSVGDSKSLTFKVWYDLLNKNEWKLVPAFEKNIYGALTILGSEYTTRIYKALNDARSNGWFRSREAFDENQAEFKELIAKACEGYNAKRQEILNADPGLKKEYDITVVQRNKIFIDSILETEEPGIIMCGGGHIQDLTEQLQKRGVSYLIAVPKGIEWPPVKKDDDKIYADMLGLGCQLKKCGLQLGDGVSIQVQLPIE